MLETIRQYGVRSREVLVAFAGVDRAMFVPEQWRELAYEDRPLPIGGEQTISQPYTVARMCELLVEGTEARGRRGAKVLEVGTGSGYETAILSRLFGKVYSMEKIPALAKQAREVVGRMGIGNVEIVTGDGKKGWRKQAPYEAIIVTANAIEVPPELVAQLGEGGRMVIPVGGEMKRGTKVGGQMRWENFGHFSFVPLR